MISNFFYVGLGGFLGAICRYGVSRLVNSLLPLSFIPWGTILVNASGSFLLAFLMTSTAQKYTIPAQISLLLGTGLLGAYTTFSTFTYEAISLYQHSVLRGILYSFVMLITGFLFALAGFIIGKN